jgi:hypothetical protein
VDEHSVTELEVCGAPRLGGTTENVTVPLGTPLVAATSATKLTSSPEYAGDPGRTDAMDVVVGVVAEAGATKVPRRPAIIAPVAAMAVNSLECQRDDVRYVPGPLGLDWLLTPPPYVGASQHAK